MRQRVLWGKMGSRSNNLIFGDQGRMGGERDWRTGLVGGGGGGLVAPPPPQKSHAPLFGFFL